MRERGGRIKEVGEGNRKKEEERDVRRNRRVGKQQ